MASFQTVTMAVAICILIITLAVTGILMFHSRQEGVFPPIPIGCPAYWRQEKNGRGVYCSPPASEIPGYSQDEQCLQRFKLDTSSKMANCANKGIAETCGWSWSGISSLRHPCIAGKV